MVELRQLRFFVTLAEELHFGRAARKLAITQPSLSARIKALELDLGLRLLDRGTRHVALTEAGVIYFAEAKAILAKVDDAFVAAHRVERGEVGRLSLGFVGLAALDTLPELLGPFRQNYPNVVVSLFEQSNEQQISNVRTGVLDVGIVREPASISGVAWKHISRDTLVLALPSSHPFAEKNRIRVTDLRDQPLIIAPRNAGIALYDKIMGVCASAGFSPHVAQETVRMATMIGLVAAGIGLAILPSIASQIHQRGVKYRRLVPPLRIDTGLIWLAESLPARRSLSIFLRSVRRSK